MIEIKHLKKAYPNITPIRDISTVINDGDIISVIGPSGTGKSTFLRCINMLETPTSGEIFIDGVCITDPKCDLDSIRKKLGMVFQGFNLFSHLMVIENIVVPQVDLLGCDPKEAEETAKELLKMVGLLDKAYNYPKELSGGQQQRVAIARTLAMKPSVILFDEPTSALDPTMVGEVQAVIKGLTKYGITMMIVTHEMEFAKSICNRVFYLDEGTIYEEGSKEDIFDNPQREKTRRFIYRLSSLDIHIKNENFDFIQAVADIENFGHKMELPSKRIEVCKAVFEEICIISYREHNENPAADIVVEYSKKTNELKLTLTYPEDNKLVFSDTSVKLLKAACDSLTQTPGQVVAMIGVERNA